MYHTVLVELSQYSFCFLLHFYSLIEWIVSPPLIQKELMIQHLQSSTFVYSGDREWFLWPLAEGLDVTLLPESRMRLFTLIWERKQENGVYLPSAYQKIFGCISGFQFLLPPKPKNKSGSMHIFGEKRSDTSCLLFIMLLQSGLPLMTDCLAIDKQQSSISIDGYLYWFPVSSLAFFISHVVRNVLTS